NKSKDEVLKIKNVYYISYFCKNDTCVYTYYDYRDSIIEIPDENGNMIKYITDTRTYDYINSLDSACIEKCNKDSQCLSNKCYHNCCMFNDETPVVHCDDIYIPPYFFRERSSYMHCGKAYLDTCKTNEECSSKDCYDGICRMQKKGPHEISLNGKPTDLYMTGPACTDTYLCKSYKEEDFIFGTTKAHLSNCYLKDKPVSKEFYPNDMINPDKCDYEGKVTLKPGPCYLMSNGNEIVKNLDKVYPAVRYFDIDHNRALTEFGWCSFTDIKDIDSNWMSYINKNLKLNEINIPGTHDSGTYNVGLLRNTNNIVTEIMKIPLFDLIDNYVGDF
ncbi:hypothetical protein PIROE2DRAFT_18158, partial [Piromyces sp. E2]